MANDFFSDEEKEQIENAIRQAELQTSGEIVVHIEKTCPGESLDRAAEVFEKLNMHKTKLRNSVLFYLAYQDHKFAILGDAGINSRVSANYWNDIKDMMQEEFRKKEFALGLEKGILAAGEQLKKNFPFQNNDVNELPDAISFGNN